MQLPAYLLVRRSSLCRRQSRPFLIMLVVAVRGLSLPKGNHPFLNACRREITSYHRFGAPSLGFQGHDSIHGQSASDHLQIVPEDAFRVCSTRQSMASSWLGSIMIILMMTMTTSLSSLSLSLLLLSFIIIIIFSSIIIIIVIIIIIIIIMIDGNSNNNKKKKNNSNTNSNSNSTNNSSNSS